MERDKELFETTVGESLAGLLLVLLAERRDVGLTDKIRCIGDFAIDLTTRLIKTATPK